MQAWIPWIVGTVGGVVLGLAWLGAVAVLLNRRKADRAAVPEMPPAPQPEFEPIRSLLDPDDREPSTPLPSTSMAPLSLSRYVEVRGAIEGWTEAGENVDVLLDEVFGVTRTVYDEAHVWWMMALAGADDRLDDIDRQVAVFAARYGGAV